jgi:hypothetical protein
VTCHVAGWPQGFPVRSGSSGKDEKPSMGLILPDQTRFRHPGGSRGPQRGNRAGVVSGAPSAAIALGWQVGDTGVPPLPQPSARGYGGTSRRNDGR